MILCASISRSNSAAPVHEKSIASRDHLTSFPPDAGPVVLTNISSGTAPAFKVPEIAGAHHEKLDGSGYPLGLAGEEINLQARILAMADIFESLSANDRPYRDQPLSREKVFSIVKTMVDSGHLDADLYALFLTEGLYKKFDSIKKHRFD
mgnify:CR=1 FL=1